MDPLLDGWSTGLLLQPLRRPAVQDPRRPERRFGEHQIRAEFAYDGGGLAKGGLVTLYVDGDKVGEGRVDATQPMLFSADETTDVGNDAATSVTDDLGPGETRFNGKVRWVQLDIGDDADDADHYITAEERLRIAMAVQ